MIHFLKQQKGYPSVDWFSDLRDGYKTLHFILHYNNNSYIHEQVYDSRDDIHPQLLSHMSTNTEVLGTMRIENLCPVVEEEMPETQDWEYESGRFNNAN